MTRLFLASLALGLLLALRERRPARADLAPLAIVALGVAFTVTFEPGAKDPSPVVVPVPTGDATVSSRLDGASAAPGAATCDYCGGPN